MLQPQGERAQGLLLMPDASIRQIAADRKPCQWAAKPRRNTERLEASRSSRADYLHFSALRRGFQQSASASDVTPA